jgi:hypothetical protein
MKRSDRVCGPHRNNTTNQNTTGLKATVAIEGASGQSAGRTLSATICIDGKTHLAASGPIP